MKLRSRFLLLMMAIFVGVVLLSWFIAERLSQNVNEEWGKQLVQRQVMFDKYRTLSPLQREIALARKLAAEPTILRMAQSESDPAVRAAGLAILEQYRAHFRDHSYFAAFAASGHYYFNDADSQYRGRQLRYTLSRTQAADQWFYATLADGRDYQINLDPDVHLGVTKIWINVLIRDGQRVLGVIGTGLDLTDFLKETVGVAVSGVHNVFVNQNLAIQLHNDPKLIDYMSVAKRPEDQIRVDRLLLRKDDVRRLESTMQQLKGKPDQVETMWVEFSGERHLLGVSWLPELGWYDLTLINPLGLMLADDTEWILLSFGGLLLFSLAVLAQGLRRWVLWPIVALQKAVLTLQLGGKVDDSGLAKTGELGQLSRAFVQMAQEVQENQRDLEAKVQSRTEALQRLTELDPLTGLLNRRGLMVRLERELARQARSEAGLGILLLDLDFFKRVNDNYGHVAGDFALIELSRILQDSLREYDYAARWGGEEFLVVVPACDQAGLLALAERIRSSVAALVVHADTRAFSFTVSLGACHSTQSHELDELLRVADDALYAAKAHGRNQTILTSLS